MSNAEMPPILVGLDPDPDKRTALAWAADEAHDTGFPLLLVLARGLAGHARVHRTALAKLSEEGRRVLDSAVDFVARAHPEVPVATRLVEDDPAQALRRQAEQAAMAVLSTRRPDAGEGWTVSSPVVGPVLKHARCPVVVVRESARSADSPPFFLVGVDGSEPSRHALEFAFRFAAVRGASLRAVHAWWPPLFGAADERTAMAEAGRLLAEQVAEPSSRFPQVPVEKRVIYGHAVETLVEAGVGARGVVVGSRGRGGFAGMVLGSVSQGLLHHAAGPVVVVPGSADPERFTR